MVEVVPVPFDFAGLATLITSIGVLIGAFAAAYATITQTKKVRIILEQTTAIDNAVNNRDVGRATIGDEVSEIHRIQGEGEVRRVGGPDSG
jgi:hypothetical protein